MRAAIICFGLLTAIPLTAATPTQAPGQSSLVCYEAAKDETTLGDERAQDLCQGSDTDWPVRCFNAAQDRTTLSDRRGILLCQCARSLRPVDCYERADDRTDLSPLEKVSMCSARTLNEVFLPYCTPAPTLNPF